MRGIQTPVRNVRRRIFKEIAKFGYEQRNLQDLEDLPYEIVPGEVAKYRDSIYRERAIVGERLRLAMGMSLNPADKPTRITKGIDESNISEKYYEPPLLQVIPSACNECKEKAFIVGEQCQGCMAHPCMEVCPKKAISFKDGYSYIDQEKCIKCGQCKRSVHMVRFMKENVLVQMPVGLEQSKQIMQEELRSIQINVFLVVCVW